VTIDASVSEERLQRGLSALVRAYPTVSVARCPVRLAGAPHLLSLWLPPELSRSAVSSMLASTDNRVVHIEPNTRGTVQQSHDDPDYGLEWAMENIGQPYLHLRDAGTAGHGTHGVDIRAARAWERLRPDGSVPRAPRQVYVALIDNSVNVDHPDLRGAFVNPGEDANGDGVIGPEDINGCDDDDNGLVDDVHGWNFVTDSPNLAPGANFECQHHGTAIAGVIAARAGNHVGIVGVAGAPFPGGPVRLIGAAVSDDGQHVCLQAANCAILYAVALHDRMATAGRGDRLVAINTSWIFDRQDAEVRDSLGRAVMVASDHDILTVAGVRNRDSGSPYCPDLPGGLRRGNVIAVTSIDAEGNPANSWHPRRVHISAPGSNVWSTLVDGTWGDEVYGSSIATPFVTGVAALLAGAEPTLSAEEIRRRILASARPMPALEGRTTTCGMLDAERALDPSSTGGCSQDAGPSSPCGDE